MLECLARQSGRGISSEYCRKRLLAVYEKTGDQEAYRKTLLDYVSLEKQNDIEKYEELKKLYKTKEWLDIRESVYQNIWKNNRELLPDILLRDGQMDRFLKLAISGIILCPKI